METTSSHEAGLMAAWRATGGAGGALRETAGEDDGLAAYGISRSVLYCGDDGLAATVWTGRTGPYSPCAGDDGLEARAPSFGGNDCRADDGLEAGASTVGQYCIFYVEFKACSRTTAWHCADDEGLAAGGRQTSFGCLLIDDGLKAGYRTGFGCYRGDDGLTAIPAATHPLFCRVDDGLTAGGYASTIGAFCW